jgi:hypothetical protein
MIEASIDEWIKNTINECISDKLSDDTRNIIINKLTVASYNKIKDDIDLTVLLAIKRTISDPDKDVCVRLISTNPFNHLTINLLYQNRSHQLDRSGLFWSIIGDDMINIHGYFPLMYKPIHISYNEIRYSFHENKCVFLQLVLELSLLHEYIKKYIFNSKSIVSGLLGVDIVPNLSFVREYDDMFGTALIDLIKVNPHKGIKPVKTIIDRYDIKAHVIYNFNRKGDVTMHPDLLIDGIALLSRHIPILYKKRIRWSMCQSYKKSFSFVKWNLRRFWESGCVVSLMSFSRHTLILIKSSDYGKMYVVNPVKGLDNYEQNTSYNNILKIANQLGISFVFLEVNDQRNQYKGSGKCVLTALARAIYVCMSLMIEYGSRLCQYNHLSDIIDENKLMKFLCDPFNDSIALLATSVIKKNKTVQFNPIIEYLN